MRLKRVAVIFAGILASAVLLTGIIGYFYWRSLRSSPQYSLALLVDAAKRDDQPGVARIVDSDAVVDGLLPQVIEKAAEIYGRGQPNWVIQRATRAAEPLLPAVKEKARAELPGLIRRETSRYGDVSFPLMVLGAGRYLDIRIEGETAFVKSRNPEQTVEFKMVRSEGIWKVNGVHDDKLASEIAQRIGQELIGMAISGKRPGLGVKNLDSLIEQLQQAGQ